MIGKWWRRRRWLRALNDWRFTRHFERLREQRDATRAKHRARQERWS